MVLHLARVAVACDRCRRRSDITPQQADEQGWFTGLFRLSGICSRWHVCPDCVAAWLDPADDIPTELRRFALEDRLAGPPRVGRMEVA